MLVADMTIVVPQPDRWLRQLVFIAQRTQARCAQQKESAGPRLQTEPPGGEHPQEVAAGKSITIMSRAKRPPVATYGLEAGNSLAARTSALAKLSTFLSATKMAIASLSAC